MAAVAPRVQAPPAHARHDVASNTVAGAAAGAPPQHTPPHSVGSASVSPSSLNTTSPKQQQQPSATAMNNPPPSRVSLDLLHRPAQMGRPKPVDFIPAALRPTERPRAPKQDGHFQHRSTQSRGGPPTPPHSLSSSTDNLPNSSLASSRNSSSSSTSTNTLTKTTSSTKPVSIDTTTRPISSRAASALSSPTASLSSLSLTGLAAAATSAPGPQHPTRAHWKPDSMAPTCDAPTCPVSFSTFTRRHHCRRCGGIFCYRHANRQVLLDTEARMVPTPALSTTDSASVPASPRAGNGITPSSGVNWSGEAAATTPDGADEGLQMRSDVGMWRACDTCHAEWTSWTKGLREEAERAGANGGVGAILQLPAGLGLPVDGARKSSVGGSLAGSVPRDWSWSTF